MEKFIPLSVPNFNGNELKYVTDAIETEWVSTGGAYINKFEDAIAKYVNVDGAVACQSGTSGIHLSLILSGVKPGDEVIVPTLTFIAAVNPVKYIGADPIFMDCDDSLTMDCDKLQEFCENECRFENNELINKLTGKTIKAIVVVHVFGNIANMEKIMNIAHQYNLKVVEDSTEALGSKYSNGRYAGTIADFGVYSFNGNKIITTGGGGMIISTHKDLLEKARYLSTQAKDDTLHYVHNEVGYNYRMTNLQAALGLAQIEQLDEFIETKKKNYFKYKELLSNIKNVSILDFNENIEPNYWFYSLCVDKDVDTIIERLNKNKIQSRPIWGLIHKQKPYANHQSYKIEKAEEYVRKIVNIPCSSNLSDEDVQRVASVIREVLAKA